MSIVTKSDWTKLPGPAHTSVRVGNSVIPLATNARNRGFTVSSNAIMDKNVTNICRSAYAELWCIGNIHHLLTVEVIKTLVSAFIPSKLDCLLAPLNIFFSWHLTNRTQSVSIHCHTSEPAPISFTDSVFHKDQYMDLYSLFFVHSFSFHCHRKALNPPPLICQWLTSRNLWPPHQIPHLLLLMQKCIDDLKTSMTVNKLNNKLRLPSSRKAWSPSQALWL